MPAPTCRRLIPLSALIALCLASGQAAAATFTWGGGNGYWDELNWTSTGAPDDDVAVVFVDGGKDGVASANPWISLQLIGMAGGGRSCARSHTATVAPISKLRMGASAGSPPIKLKTARTTGTSRKDKGIALLDDTLPINHTRPRGLSSRPPIIHATATTS